MAAACFADRAEAGRKLAARLDHLQAVDPVVVGLPRGGVPVAAAVARAIDAPLDVIMVRKLGVPSQPEVAMGAVGEGGVRVLDAETVRLARVDASQLSAVEAAERAELERRSARFAIGRTRLDLADRVVVVVDDGIATGSTARAACQVVRAQGAARVVLAVPVAPPGWILRMAGAADEYVCCATPDPFLAVGRFYADFTQTGDDEVVRCLRNAAMRSARTEKARLHQG